MQTDFSTQRLDHLGLVAGTCFELGLIEAIDELVGPTDRKVSVGEATQAMILNGLGFVSRALYLAPEFFANKPTDILIADGITPEELNDDCLGDALDRLFEAGLTEVFYSVAKHAVQRFELESKVAHLDSTSISFEGEFDVERSHPAEVRITHGYNKDGRQDLKQLVVQLICSAQGGIPLWFEALSGNSSDKATFAHSIDWFIENLRDDGELSNFVIIADSALYKAESLPELASEVTFVTRVPATLNEVRTLYENADLEAMTVCADDERYHFQWHESTYGEVSQRWLLVHSQPSRERGLKTLAKKVETERSKADKALRKLASQRFGCEADALKALATTSKRWKYHSHGEGVVEEHKSYSRRGRPAKDEPPTEVSYSVSADVVAQVAQIEAARAKLGLFVLATNELDEARLDGASLLRAYKGQNPTVERGFRFLKDPLFFADGLYLQKPSRVMAMMMVMTLCLLVYSVAELHLRRRLRAENETLPDQKGKPTQSLTMRRVFQVFDGIDVLVSSTQGVTVKRQVLNMTELRDKILAIMGPTWQKCYEVPG